MSFDRASRELRINLVIIVCFFFQFVALAVYVPQAVMGIPLSATDLKVFAVAGFAGIVNALVKERITVNSFLSGVIGLGLLIFSFT